MFTPPTLWSIPQPDYSNAQCHALTEMLDTRLHDIATHSGKKVFMTSLAVEDMIITDSIARQQLEIDIVMLDTGMLNEETVALANTTQQHFNITLKVMTPCAEDVSVFVDKNGRFSMYESLALRQQCCPIRKINPLNKALDNASAWLTGQRRSQSSTREQLCFKENDHARGMLKFNPIYDFSETDVWAYAHHHALPLNPLYQKGYASIGCAPCSKAIRADEPIRAGRWWWEHANNKECGLHTHQAQTTS